jgi:hypothetical protein
LAQRAAGGIRRRETAILAFALLLLLRATGGNGTLYRAVWSSMRSLLPVLAVVGVIVLWRTRDADTRSPLLRAQTMLLISVTALCSLVQFPFSVPNYFCYVAPLVALTTLALYKYMRPAGAMPGLLVAFFAAFAALRVNSSPLQSMGIVYEPRLQMAPLALERAGGIEVPWIHAVVYDSLVPMLRAHARGGYTWASPDTPEIYFLSDLRNPTRTLFEIFDDSTNRNVRVLRALDEHGVTAVVLNRVPSFSSALTREMRKEMAKRYPNAQYVGPYQLRWRE